MHRYQSQPRSVFELCVLRGVKRVHWDIGEGTDVIVLLGLMEEFMILYLICLYGDLRETLGKQQLEYLKGTLIPSY